MKKYLQALLFAAIFTVFPLSAQTETSTSEILYPPFSDLKPIVDKKIGSDEECKAFFEANYRATWDKLSEFEQYAIAFSSNLFQLNNDYHLDFCGKAVPLNNPKSLQSMLKDDWGISGYDSLVETFNSLLSGGHSGAYKKMSALLDKYPDKAVLTIAIEEGLSVTEVSRLYYVRDTRKLLGFHDIEAWDLGRAITIIRWGIAVGYISEEEGKELCEPVVEQLRKDYVDWYDYLAHYVQGRGFYGIFDCSSEELMQKAIAAAALTLSYIPLEDLTFSGENADREHAVSFYTYILPGSADVEAWQKVQKLYSGKQNAETLEKLCALEEGEFLGYSKLFFGWHVDLLSEFGTSFELVEYISNNSDGLDYLAKDEERYVDVLYTYLASLNAVCMPQYVLEIFTLLPQELQFNSYFYYQYVNANYLMLSLCETQNELDRYRETAKNGYILLQQNDFELSDTQKAWLNIVR